MFTQRGREGEGGGRGRGRRRGERGGERRERGREGGEGPGFCPLTFTGAGHLDRADIKNIKERRSRWEEMSLLIGAFIKGAEEEGGKGSRLEEVKFMRTFRVWNIKQSPKWCWNVSAGSASCCDSTEFMILWSVATEPPGYIQHLLLSPQTHLENASTPC